MIVRYEKSSAAWENYTPFLEHLIEVNNARNICEIGAGANPSLSLDFIARAQLDYVLVDVSASELAKAPDGYRKITANILTAHHQIGAGYDMIVSRMVLEHVDQPSEFHSKVYDMLGESGRAFHFFPTLYAPPFVLNAILPEKLTTRLLPFALDDREADGKYGKFPAYYRWCRGPTRRQMARFRSLGYEVEEYVGFFGHGYYRKFPPLQAVQDRLTGFLVNHPLPQLTSLAFVVLRKQNTPLGQDGRGAQVPRPA